jgi:hypothetical protein
MSNAIVISRQVLVLGDTETVAQADSLSEIAENHGHVATAFYGFDVGAGCANDDLIVLQPIIAAVGAAIATGSDLWVPWPHEDLTREAHVRRIALVLHRHGRNLLLGPHLHPVPTEGGISEIDFALRTRLSPLTLSTTLL